MKEVITIVLSISLMVVMGCSRAALDNFSTQRDTVPVYVRNEKAKLVGFNGSEPNGFNGMKWGTQFSSLEGMKLYGKQSKAGKIKFYTREGDVFKLANGQLERVQYGFWKDIFYVGEINTQGLSNWNALKEVVFATFGEGTKPFKNREEYLWVGRDATMALRYDEISEIGTYYIRSDSVAKRMESHS